MANGSKLLSGRVPVVPLDQLTADRYQYLAVGQAEPNLGNGVANSVLAIQSNGNRIWTNTVVLTAGTFSGNVSAANFIGNITGNITAPGSNTQILFNDSGIVAGNSALTFNKATSALTVTGDATVTGNLTVGGNVSYINVTNLNIQDPIVGIGRGANNAPLVTNDGKDRGEQLWYYSGSEKSAFIGYKNSAGNLILATNVSITNEIVTVNNYGNVTAGNISAQFVVASANINAANLIASSNIAATGNVSATYFLGNGAFLTGIDTTLIANGTSNVKVTASGGNVAGSIGGVANVWVLATTGEYVSGVISATGNITGGNLTTTGTANVGTLAVTGTATVTGNVIGGNLTTTGTANVGTLAVTGGASIAGNISGNLNVTGNTASGNILTPGLVSATGNITGGNLNTSGLILATGNITGGNLITTGIANVGTLSVTGSGNVTGNVGVAGNISAGNVISKKFDSNNINLSAPGPGNTAAERLVVYNFNNPAETNYAIGVENSYIWTAVDIASDALGFKWYGGNTLAATLTSSGKLTTVGNITGSNLNTAGLVLATGNVIGGNLTTTGTANVGTLAVTGTSSFIGNVVGNLNVTGNTASGNISTPGLIAATGNVTGGNIITAGRFGWSGTGSNSRITNNGTISLVPDTSYDATSGIQIGGSGYLLGPNGSRNITLNYNSENGVAGVFRLGIVGNQTEAITNYGSNATGSIGNASSYFGNAYVNNVLTNIVNAAGNVTGANINTAGLISATGNITGGNLTTTGTANIGTLEVTGTTSLVGNVTGNLNVTGNTASGNVLTPGLISATGNVSGGNLTTAGLVSATGNVTGGNLTTTGLVSATGNITSGANIAGNFVAAGSNRQVMFNDNGLISSSALFTFDKAGPTISLTNAAGTIITGYVSSLGGTDLSLTPGTSTVVSWANINPRFSNTWTLGTSSAQWKNVWAGNANIGTLGVTSITATGNVTGGNLTTTGTANVGTLAVTGTSTFAGNVGGNLNVTGNIAGGNVTTPGLILATGNVTGGNLVTGGNIDATGNIAGGNVTTPGLILATGNVTGGNLNTAGQVVATGNITGDYITAQSNLAVLGNKITTGTTTGLSFEPGNVSLISGNIIVNGGYIYSQNGDTAIALVNNGEIGSVGIYNNLQVGKDGQGNLDVSGYANLTSDVSIGGYATITGNVSGGNISTAGQIDATGNVTGGNLITSGIVTATGNINTTANINAANIVTANINATSAGLTIAAAPGGDYNIFLIPTGNGTVDVGDHRITNIGTPTQADDAATKQYVDDSVSAGIHIHQPVQYKQSAALTATYANGGTSVTVDSISGTKTLTFTTSPALLVNDEIVFTNSFNGLSANTAYFVYSSNGSNQVTLSTSYGGVELTGLTNGGPGLAQAALVNSGVGATLTNAGANVAFTPTGTVTPAIVGDRILVHNQANAVINGVYAVTTVGAPDSPGPGSQWVLTRAVDSNKYAPQDPNGAGEGDYFYITSGSGAGESYVLTSPIGPIIFGQSNIGYTQFSATQIYSGANGVAINGQIISANVDNDTTAIVSGNIVVKAGANLTTPNIGAATGVSLNVTGNIVANNISLVNYVAATTIDASANISGGNINSNGAATVTGNVSANNIVITTNANIFGNIHSLGNAHFGQDLSFLAAQANMQYAGTANSYVQLVMQNKDNGINASTDFVATADNGTDFDTYIDLGINSSQYNQTAYELAGPNDGYLLMFGNTTTGGGNLIISTFTNKDIVFSTGGGAFADEVGRFQHGNGFLISGNTYSTGNVHAPYFIGNVFGNIEGNLAVNGPNTGVVFNDDGVANSSTGFTFDKTSNNVVLAGNLTVGNIATLGTANVGTLITTANATVTGNISGGNITTTGLISATGNVTGGNVTTSGTANVGTLITTANATVTGNISGGNITTTGLILATGNITGGNLTTTGTANVGTLVVTGNVTGNLDVTGNVSANYYLGNGYYLTGIITSVSNINNGTSNVRIDAAGGNILANVGGTANVVVISSDTLTVTGNIVSNNGYFIGNGVYLTGVVAASSNSTGVTNINYGTSNVRIETPGGNILANVGGVANVVAITPVGANITGTLGVTGNTTSGNLDVVGDATVVANISGGNVTTAGLISATGNITGGNLTTTGIANIGTLSVTGSGNVSGNLGVTGNVSANYYLGNGAFLTGVITSVANINNGTSNLRIDTSGGNILANVGGVANVLAITTIGANVTGNLGVTGNINANYYLGNGYYLTGISVAGSSNIANGTSNVNIPIVNGNVNTSVGNTANVFVVTTGGANVTGNLDVTGNISAAYFIGNANASSLTSGIVPSARLTGTYAIDISGLAARANTVTDAAQPNITSVGTLTSLTVTGNVTGGNLITAGTANVGVLVATGNASAANLNTTGVVSATGNVIGGNLTTTGLVSASGNVTGGNLTTAGLVSATGNVVGGNLTTTGLISATGNITATGNVQGNFVLGNGYYLTGIITSVSNINNGTSNVRIDVSGGNILANVGGTANVMVISSAGANITGNLGVTGNVSANYFIGNGSQLTGIAASVSNINNGTSNLRIDTSGGNILANVGGTANVLTISSDGLNVTGFANVTGNVIGGNLTTTGIANITTLSVTGDALVTGNLTVNGNTNYINVTNLNIQDPIIGIGRGANNAPLTTNDSKDRGEQLWYYSGSEKSAFIGWQNSSGNLIAATNVSITGEVVTVNNYGNITLGNVSSTTVVASGNVTGGNIITAGVVTATGNITGGNITANSNISGNYVLGNGYYLTGIASLTSVYYQLTVQGNVSGNSLGNSTLTASNTSGILYPRSGNGIAMVGNATTGILTISVLGSINDGTFWAANNTAGLVSAAIDAPNVDNGLVTDASLSASYDLGGFEYTANAPFNAIDSDLLPTTPNTYVVGNSALSWKSAYIEGNVTSGSGYFIGNGALLSGVLTSGGNLSNGNSNIAIVSSGGNIALTVTANANVAVFGTGVAQIKGNVVPAANAAYNLGSSTLQWNSLYVAGNTIYLGNIALKAGSSNSLQVYGSDGTTAGSFINTTGFSYNSANIAANTNVTATYNSMSTGPVTINNNVIVTVDSGATWTVV